MSLTQILRNTSLGAIGLWGGAILVGQGIWLHYWIYGLLDPNAVRPLEDWSLIIGITAFLIQFAASIEALIVSIGTRYRWISYRHGKIALWIFSTLSLSHTFVKLWPAMTYLGIVNLAVLAFEIAILLPLGIAWLLLRSQRHQ
ncbi:MAG: hypothetical protein J7647_04315 [Cyanobacteria bacterium SBLK]|nr:hypothetical protein [Cyanobacteria bacterium SBLK]